MREIMKKIYQIKRNLIIYHKLAISICLSYVDKTDFLSPQSEFRNYARAKKCYIEIAIVCILHKFLH